MAHRWVWNCALPMLLASPVLLPAAGSAQSFGTDWQVLVLGAMDFQPQDSATTWGNAGAGYIYRTAGPEAFWAALHLPAGAEVDKVCILYYDDAVADVNAEFSIYGLATFSPAIPSFQQLASVSFADDSAPGYHEECLHPSPAPFFVHTLGDLDNDGNVERLLPRILVRLPLATTNHRLGGATVFWRRTVSDPPLTATFGDVPLGHPAFADIEALQAAKITTGCGDSNYCPNDPVTRAQLAVFLARALGLHTIY